MPSLEDDLQMQRGKYGFGYAGLLAGLRLLDPIAQRYLLQTNALNPFFKRHISSSIQPPPTGGPLITTLGLNLTPYQTIVFAMSTTTVLKQVYWSLFLRRETMTLPFALFGGIIDLVFFSLNTLIFNNTASINPLWSPRVLWTGFAIHTIFISMELISELQRDKFKSNPKNAGKPFMGGLFGLARHVNYTSETLMAFGYGLAVGGPVWGCMFSSVYVLNLGFNATPSIEKYCREKYGEKWTEYEKKIPWLLIPGIY